MSEPPPIPQPSGATCPNCGAAQSASASYCTNCGAPMQAAPQSRMNPVLKFLVRTLLFLGAVGFGGLGACMGLFGLIAGSDSNGAYGDAFGATQIVIVVALIAAGLGCLWFFNQLAKK